MDRGEAECSVWKGVGPALVLLAAALLIAGGVKAQQQADDAPEILRRMSDFLAAQEQFSVAYQSSLEAVSDDFEKLEFVSSGTMQMARPDRMRVTRTGGFADLELVFDGDTLTVHGRNAGAYTQIAAPGTLADLDAALEGAGLHPPGGDLLGADVYGALMADVTEARHVSSAFVNGVEAEYLTFRTPDVDWQIWVATGERPLPLRYVVTSKHVVQAPEYTLELRDWKLGGEAGPMDFAFAPPAGAERVDLAQIDLLDELPPETGQEDAQ